jgi:REP element-mobilizing transposase RayT
MWLDEPKPKEDLMSELYQSLSHSRWNCKYHVVCVPKRRRHKLFGEIGFAIVSAKFSLLRNYALFHKPL